MILKGKDVADAICEDLSRRAKELFESGTEPVLAFVRAGEDPADIAYENAAAKRCGRIGIGVRRFYLPKDCGKEKLLETIRGINGDPSIHACLMFRPLADKEAEACACGAIDPAKDVDCASPVSAAGVYLGSGGGFAPCTPEACVEILDHYGIPVSGKHAVIIGRSAVVGKPLAMLLQKRDATVTMCHSRTERLEEICRGADILISCVGRAGFVTAGFVSPGQTVIDVGINTDADGNLCGDVDFEAVSAIAGNITPVPGGVGSVTSSVLAKHAIQAAEAFCAAGARAGSDCERI